MGVGAAANLKFTDLRIYKVRDVAGRPLPVGVGAAGGGDGVRHGRPARRGGAALRAGGAQWGEAAAPCYTTHARTHVRARKHTPRLLCVAAKIMVAEAPC